jgi:hypothetical protein
MISTKDLLVLTSSRSIASQSYQPGTYLRSGLRKKVERSLSSDRSRAEILLHVWAGMQDTASSRFQSCNTRTRTGTGTVWLL